jgi:glucokinase
MSDSQASGVRLGIDIGGTKMLVLAKTASGLRQWTFPTGLSADPGLLRGYAESVMDSLGVSRPERIGVALPGLVDAGLMRESDVLPRLRGWQPGLDWPGAVVLNDGEAALVRAAADEDTAATVVAIGCGTGIVAAVQVAGHRLRQSRPYAGELGYAPCGHAGTFDQIASGAAIQRKLGLSAAEITERLQRNDPACQDVIREAGEAFGLSVVTVIHLLPPSAIGLSRIFGGGPGGRGPLDPSPAEAAMPRAAHP